MAYLALHPFPFAGRPSRDFAHPYTAGPHSLPFVGCGIILSLFLSYVLPTRASYFPISLSPAPVSLSNADILTDFPYSSFIGVVSDTLPRFPLSRISASCHFHSLGNVLRQALRSYSSCHPRWWTDSSFGS